MDRVSLHSQFIFLAKVFLPLGALALLSTMFLFARSSGEATAIPFSEIRALAKEQRITAPRFGGVTTDGSTLQIAAVSARPAEEGGLDIDAPLLSLEVSETDRLTVVAGQGRIDDAAQMAVLSGLARLETSTGYLMETRGLFADLTTGVITSDGALEVQAPFGTLTAGAMRITSDSTKGPFTMDFTDGVKLIYVPPDTDG